MNMDSSTNGGMDNSPLSDPDASGRKGRLPSLFDELADEILPELTPIADDLGFFLDSPDLEAGGTLKVLPGHLEDHVQKMEISPLSGPGVIPPHVRSSSTAAAPRVVSESVSPASIGGDLVSPASLSLSSTIYQNAAVAFPELDSIIPTTIKQGNESPLAPSHGADGSRGHSSLPDIPADDLSSMWGDDSMPEVDGSAAMRRNRSSGALQSKVKKKGRKSKIMRKTKSNGRLDMLSKETAEEKRHKRLERNRISARMSRQRKKVLLETLQDKLNATMADMTRLRNQCLERMLTNYKKLDVTVSTHKGKMVLASYYDKYLQTNMLPTLTRFLLWLVTSLWMEKRRKTEDGRSGGTRNVAPGAEMAQMNEPGDIWKLLIRELDLSETQSKKIMAQMNAMNVQKTIPEVRKLLLGDKFFRHLRRCTRASAKRIEHLRERLSSILSVEQIQMLSTEARERESASDPRTWASPRSIDRDRVSPDLLEILQKPDANVTSDDIRKLMNFAASGGA